MKPKFAALGKALAYVLFYFFMQTMAGMGISLYTFFSYFSKYPELLNRNLLDAMELVLQMMGQPDPMTVAWGLLVSNVLAVGLIFLFFLLRRKKPAREICLNRPAPVYVGLAVLIGLTVPCITLLFSNLMPYSETQLQELESNASTLPADLNLVTLLILAIVSPIAEEVFFRGLVYLRLRRGFGVILSIAISAVIFGLGHGGTIWFISAALAGVLLAWSLERTGSLYIPIVIHICNNTVGQAMQSMENLAIWMLIPGAAACMAAIYALWKKTSPSADKVS